MKSLIGLVLLAGCSLKVSNDEERLVYNELGLKLRLIQLECITELTSSIKQGKVKLKTNEETFRLVEGITAACTVGKFKVYIDKLGE